MGPVTVDLFCSLTFTSSITEIQMCKVYPHFPLDSRQQFPMTLNRTRFAKLIGAKYSHSDIFVTDRIKINEQGISIATGPLYVHSELKRFECSYLKINVGTLLVQDTKLYFTEMMWYELKIGN